MSEQPTRRSALMLATVAPLWSQSGGTVPHPVVFFEIGCKDRAKTEQFFGQLFDWKFQSSSPLSSNIEALGQL